MFESAVHALRKRAAFAKPDIGEFMARKAYEDGCGEVVLTVNYRHSVASRLWWSVGWEQDGQRREVSAQEVELCMWRAIQLHNQLERAHEFEKKVYQDHKFGCELKGF